MHQPVPLEDYVAPKVRRVEMTSALTLLYALVASPSLLGLDADEAVRVLPISCLLALALVALSAIDALTFQLPDLLTLPLALAGVLLQAPLGISHLLQAALSAVVAFAVMAGIAASYSRVRGRAGLGLGDAKLLAAAGAWLGLAALPSVVGLASTAALACVMVAAIRRGGVALQARIPFGPFLALAFWLVWLYGPLSLELS